jgi:bifunctional non-homologous end joining protein LigD
VLKVSNADRVVFPDGPEVQRTKGDVVAYYDKIAPRGFPHVVGRPLTIKRFPKGLADKGFFQKNVLAHYPASIERFPIHNQESAKREVTTYPVLTLPEHLAYLANQGAIELHMPTARAATLERPDRIVIDLDPPAGAVALVRRAAAIAREALAGFGLATVPVATGSKGYHVIAPIAPAVGWEAVAGATHKLATLLAAQHPDVMTIAFRISNRGERVFVDWMRNQPMATVIAPYSLRARPRATVAAPLAWGEVATHAPDAFTIADVDRLLERPDTLADLAPGDGAAFVAAVDEAFVRSGLVLERFDRFRS